LPEWQEWGCHEIQILPVCGLQLRHDAGRSFTFTQLVDAEHATKTAAHEAQIIAADSDIVFDYANFSIVVKPVSKQAPVDSNTYWEVDPAL
jgi:hypothetical protein